MKQANKIEVKDIWGKPKYITKEEFIQEWKELADQLMRLDWDEHERLSKMVTEIVEMASVKADKILARNREEAKNE